VTKSVYTKYTLILAWGLYLGAWALRRLFFRVFRVLQLHWESFHNFTIRAHKDSVHKVHKVHMTLSCACMCLRLRYLIRAQDWSNSPGLYDLILSPKSLQSLTNLCCIHLNIVLYYRGSKGILPEHTSHAERTHHGASTEEARCRGPPASCFATPEARHR